MISNKLVIVLLWQALLVAGVVPTDAQTGQNQYIFDETGFQIRVLQQDVYGLGERFVYDVDYGFITAGESGLEILPELVTHRQAPCYHLHSWARSSRTFSAFFRVEDDVHAYMDARGIFSWYFEKRLNEGSYHDVKIVDYDQRAGFAYMEDDGVPKDTSMIPLYVQDALSAIYYARLQPLEVGKQLYVPTHDIRKTYPLKVNVIKRETIEVPAGTFACIKVEPVLESAGIFKQKGRIFIWFSDDEYRMPVMLKAKVLIGSIAAKLKEYKRGKPVKINK